MMVVDRVDYRRPSLARLYKEDKSYKDNFSRTYNSENVEKILSRTRSLISEFDSGKGPSISSTNYSTLPPRFRHTGSKYSSTYISSSGVTGGSSNFKSHSPSYISSYSIRSPSLSRRSIPSLRASSPVRVNSSASSSLTDASPRILNELCIPKSSGNKSPGSKSPGSNDSRSPHVSPSRREEPTETRGRENSDRYSERDRGKSREDRAGKDNDRDKSETIRERSREGRSYSLCNGRPSTSGLTNGALSEVRERSATPTTRRRSSGVGGLFPSNAVKYEKCYNDLLSRINHIKINGGDILPEGRSSNVPEFDRSKKPTQDRVSHYDRREQAVAGSNVGPGLTGLRNLGNTCYINSILQCLSNTTPLRQFFEHELGKSFTSCHVRAGGKLAEEFLYVLKMLWAGDTRYFSPNKFKEEVGKMKRTFRGYDQQDSHEFLTILIDSLHEELKKSIDNAVLTGASVESGEKSWGEFISKNQSIVSSLFYGQLKSTVICLSCQETSSTFEVFSNVSLPLPSHDHCSLRECLDLYLKDEEIQGWHCPRCKTKRDARKKLDITKLPPILVLHFKRFTSDGWCRKKQTTVEFPDSNLNMREWTTNPESRDVKYDLYAVSNHYGTMESGHYTAYCKNKKWYKFDDSDVSEISASKVKSSAAYILFYVSTRVDY